jgi:hypothetical protein
MSRLFKEGRRQSDIVMSALDCIGWRVSCFPGFHWLLGVGRLAFRWKIQYLEFNLDQCIAYH